MIYMDTNKDAPEYIYAIVDNAGAVKLGRTNNIHDRLRELQTGNRNILEVLYVKRVKDAIKAENSLHAIFVQWRTRGEWFELTDKVEALLYEIFAHKNHSAPRLAQLHILGLE